jgi:glycine dehydrogenase
MAEVPTTPYYRPFHERHIGPSNDDVRAMLRTLGYESMDELLRDTIPENIRFHGEMGIGEGISEKDLLDELRQMAAQNDVHRSFIGMGYHDTVTPPVIQRNILENPNWYTHYTPYQSEISQGRLEALLNFQTMVADLTGMDLANASLLDEGTAAAEAMSMMFSVSRSKTADTFLVSRYCHPQTIAVVGARAAAIDVHIVVGDPAEFQFDDRTFGALLQYPHSDGAIVDYSDVCDRAHDANALVAVAADLLALTLIESPAELGADVAVGSTQRFGVPLGYGGPHAGYFATRDKYKRKIPGRLIGVSQDANGDTAFRMALQTREQHIRRERATSNICTAQVLLAVMAGAYAVYHGPEGLERIATRVHRMTRTLAEGLSSMGHEIRHDAYFDTLRVDPAGSADSILAAAKDQRVNLRSFDDGSIGISLDEPTTLDEVDLLLEIFARAEHATPEAADVFATTPTEYDGPLPRTTSYMDHPNFHLYQTETDMMRYLKRLSSKDVSLTDHMIPLGSCTMKLNAAAELMAVSWPSFNGVHPFAPVEQCEGYQNLIDKIEDQLRKITALPAVSVQPNSGAQGEYAGLLAIRSYHDDHGEPERRICLIPESAHGTNAASAVMAGLDVESVATDKHGNIDLDDLRTKAEEHADDLAGLMITYPSTHGVFETDVRAITEAIHDAGGLVYMDGANMNAQVGLCRPGDYGVDVCHLNLHKTFAIPHGGGGPGVGPICAAEHLADYLPGHPIIPTGGAKTPGPIAAAPWGSASILIISWAYIRLMGDEGLRRASEVAILNANYMAERLEANFPVLFKGVKGRVAHEFIIDLRDFDKDVGVSVDDVAKRLIDFGFHAPTMSWPVAGTMMVEPTESESKAELDRLCEAFEVIRDEIRQIEDGMWDADESPLRYAPHTSADVMADEWDRPYTREQAAFPAEFVRDYKYWPPVRRVDNVYGDRNLFCSCPPLEDLAS